MSISAVSPVSVSKPSFCGKQRELISTQDFPDRVENTYKTEASTGKKWGVGIASGCISGLGQFINGDVKKGLAYLGGALLLSAAARRISTLFVIPALAVNIASIVDAVKNAGSTEKEIVMK